MANRGSAAKAAERERERVKQLRATARRRNQAAMEAAEQAELERIRTQQARLRADYYERQEGRAA